MKHFLEGGDLVAGDLAVGLGHLGAEHDNGDGEGDALGGIARLALAVRRAQFVDRMASDRADQRAQRTTERKARGAAEYFTPNAHVIGFTRFNAPGAVPDCSALDKPRKAPRPAFSRLPGSDKKFGTMGCPQGPGLLAKPPRG